MKIALLGNVCNNSYQIAKALRQYSNIDAHLYVYEGDDLTTMPESDDPELSDNYPHWIHRNRFVTPITILFPWKSALVRELAKYDLTIVSGFGLIYSQFTNKPSYFFVTGGDLTIQPFPLEYLFRYRTIAKKIGHLVIGFWQRRGIHKATEIWTQPFSPFVNALERLNVKQEQVSPVYFPVMMNTEKLRFDERARDSDDENIRQIVDNYDFVVFHPSRILIDDHPSLKAVGEWKRNELLIEGFANFLKQSQSKKSVLVIPDRIYSPDIPLAKKIIESLGIEKNVLWIKAARPTGFTRDELIRLYSIADVVADDFGIGWFGSVVLEAFSIGCPVISYVNEQVMKFLYPWHPILSAKSSDDIASYLVDLYKSPEYRNNMGNKGRQWVEDFHSTASASKIYVQRIAELAERLGLEV